MALKIVTPPASEPVTLTEAKSHLRVDASDDDTLITALITAAREWCEYFRRQSFITQTLEYYLDAFPESDTIYLPRGPVQSVTSITYTDESGTATVMDSNDYVVDAVSEPARLTLKASASWPSATLQPVNGVAVRYVAGYGAASDVPETVKAAIKLLVGHLYENRENVVIGGGVSAIEVPLGVRALLWPQRVVGFK